jgi:hypothetical protein
MTPTTALFLCALNHTSLNQAEEGILACTAAILDHLLQRDGQIIILM